LTFYLDDGIGNPMAANTTLAPKDVSSNVAVNAFLPSSVLALGARPPDPLIDLPNTPKPLAWTAANLNGNVPSRHTVTVQGVESKCAGTASFTLGVTSPRGGAAAAQVLIEGQPRNTGGSSFPVLYSNLVTFSLGRSGLTATVTPLSWIGLANGPAAASYRIDWGDGVTSTGTTPGGIMPNVPHAYALAGAYSVTLTIVDANGTSVSSSSLVSVN
jgi:PKD repeat protein